MEIQSWIKSFHEHVVPELIDAENKTRFISRTFCVAQKNIRLNFSNPHIEKLFVRSLLHLECDEFESTDLELFVLERREPILPKTRIISHEDTEELKKKYLWQIAFESISTLNRETNQGFFLIDDLSQLGDWNFAKPFRTLLHWYLSSCDLSMLHGAVVAGKKGGVLITAKGGSGKTTTALSCFFNDLYYLSDDYSAIDAHSMNSFSLYNSAMLTPDNLLRFPSLLSFVENPERQEKEKAMVFLHRVKAERLIPETKLKAVLIPRVTGTQETKFTTASKAEVLMAVAPTISSLKEFEQEKLSSVKRIALNLPAYHIHLGIEMNEVANKIANFIDNEQ